MSRHATICIDNNLAPGQPGITHRTTCDEPSRRIDEKFGGAIKQVLRNHRLDDMLDDIVANLLLVHILSMLCRNNHSIDAHRSPVLILNRDLTFPIGTQVGHRSTPAPGLTAYLRQLTRNFMSKA